MTDKMNVMNIVINDYLSKKFKALSFVAVILVVYLHSHNQDVRFASGKLAGEQSYFVLFVENFFSRGVARVAAPLFFTISGFLFYNSFDFTMGGIIKKFKKRFNNLCIPYFFWSILGMLFILLLQLIPWSKNFFTKELIIHYSFSELLLTIFLNPIPYQLWFVRDLIMLTICSPIIWYLTQFTRGAWLIILVVLWIVAPKTFELFSNEALFFFSAGCALVLDKDGLIYHKFSKDFTYLFLALWLLTLLLISYLLTLKQDVFIVNMLNNLGIITGILSIWSLYDFLNQEYLIKYSALFGYSFFIFVFHEPLLTILIKGMFYILGKTDFSSLLIYIVAPLVAIGVSILVRYFLKRCTPRLYNFATGDR